MAEEVKQQKQERPKFIMYNNMKYLPLPPEILKEMRQGGILRNHHEKIIRDNHEAMLKHKEYYEKVMKQWNYNVKDPIPSIEIIRDVLFTFETYLFGWFALRMDPDYNYVLEDSIRLMREYIEDIKAGRIPRCTRDI